MKLNNKVAMLLLAGICFLTGRMLLWSQNLTPVTNTTQTDAKVNTANGTTEKPTLDNASLTDSLTASKTKIDSLFYAADSIYYNYQTEQIFLYGNTSVKYQSSTILADSLQIDLKGERAFSKGRTVLIDNDQVLIGNQVYYDVNSQTGMMYDTASKLDKGFYYGREVRKVDDDIYDIDDGRFTTCDDPNPDFWFWSRKMRLYRGDKIVGKPVVAYVNHVPIFYFPFVTFSIKRGRQPGLLVPEPGYNTVDGKYVRNLAMFYPYRDYADATIGFDLMEKTGWKSNLQTRYTKRYYFNGNFDGALQKYISGSTTTVDYSLRGYHHQELGEKSTFDANIDYVSNKRIWNSSTDINESLAQRITSSMSYSKPILSSYLNVGASYTEDLINNTVNVTLPSATFSLPSRPVYEIFTNKEETASKTSWWSNFNYSYNVRLDHTGYLTQGNKSIGEIIWDNTPNTTGTGFINEHHIGIKQSAGLNYNYKVLGWLNLTQSFYYNEVWMDRDKNDVKWVRGNDYSTSSNANFTLYGIRNFKNFYVSTLRHIVTPSASFRYTPSFTDNSRFYSFGGIGLSQSKRSRFISLGLDQKWQLKLAATDNQKERKLDDFIRWYASTGVNLEKEDHKFTDITHTFSLKPASFSSGKFKLTYSTGYNLTQNPYELQWLNWKTKNQYFSHTLSLSGNAPTTDYFPRAHNQIFSSYLTPADSLGITSKEPTATTSEENWSVSISQDMSTDKNIWHPRNNNLRMNASFNLTPNWSLAYTNYYNITNSKMLSQSLDISRTLHCWKLSISYTRRTGYWDYRIVFFNTELPDALKFQTRDYKRY